MFKALSIRLHILFKSLFTRKCFSTVNILVLPVSTDTSSAVSRGDLPRVGAVVVENVELGGREQLASVDARLDGAESAQDAHLLDVAHHGNDLEPFQLRVDGVQSADEVLEEEIERLRQADELAAVDVERGELRAAVVDDAHLVVLGGVARDGRGLVRGLLELHRVGRVLRADARAPIVLVELAGRERVARRREAGGEHARRRAAITCGTVFMRHDAHGVARAFRRSED